MFRQVLLATLALLTACSGQPQGTNQSAAAAVTPSPKPSAPTTDMLAAKKVAQLYFDRLHAGDYAGALALWSEDAASANGGLKSFASASRAEGRFEGRAGDPTGVRDSGGMRYVLVESSARVTSPKGRVSERAGVVMLKQPAQNRESWRIWGIDIRPRHCRDGQVARGLGCVQV